MQLDKFTNKSQQAIQDAQRLAHGYSHQELDGEHLLLALIELTDDDFAYVGAWEWNGIGQEPTLHKEPLEYENVHFATRSYK